MVINAALAKQIADESGHKALKELKEETLKQVLYLINYAANDGLYEMQYYPEHKNKEVIEFVRSELMDLNYVVGSFSLKNGLNISWY